MFFSFPAHVTETVRELALLLNTGILIVTLIIVELIYSERPRSQRAYLRYFYPFVVVLIGLLVYTAYLEGVKK